jgi:hypothetical protein
MKPRKNEFHVNSLPSLQEEFAGVVTWAVVELSRDIESLRGRMGESERQVEELFESLLNQSFGG